MPDSEPVYSVQLVQGAPLVEVRVEGWRAVQVALGTDAGILAELEAGRVPREWAPLETTTDFDSVSVWAAVSVTVSTTVNVPLAPYGWLTTAPAPVCPFPKFQL